MAELKKILYVEDEPDIQAIAQLALESVGGFEVTICSSGQEAIEKAPGINPDMILLDVMMPGIDGPETLKRLREISSLKDTPAVFLTAKAMATEIDLLMETGALEVIAKPFDPMTISDQLRKIWDAREN